METISTLARRTLYDVIYAAAVGVSHVEATVTRFHQLVREDQPSTPDACPLCDAALEPHDRRTGRLEWYRCSGCGMAQAGRLSGEAS